LQNLPPLNICKIWGAQIEAVTCLEASLAQDKPRALIQMATGSEKMFTAFEVSNGPDQQPRKEVKYNPRLLIEFFDIIIVDACHRSIYNLWCIELEYFDADLIV
jgi:type I site-specific restriction endonuclease